MQHGHLGVLQVCSQGDNNSKVSTFMEHLLKSRLCAKNCKGVSHLTLTVPLPDEKNRD